MNAASSVLVVDDDLDLRSTVVEALTDEGFDVSEAENGRAALDVLHAGTHPDVILLDLMMPEMDGAGFRAEQEKDPAIAAIPVLVFTAYDVPREAMRQLNVQGWLKKPLRLHDLLAAVNRFKPEVATSSSTD